VQPRSRRPFSLPGLGGPLFLHMLKERPVHRTDEAPEAVKAIDPKNAIGLGIGLDGAPWDLPHAGKAEGAIGGERPESAPREQEVVGHIDPIPEEWKVFVAPPRIPVGCDDEIRLIAPRQMPAQGVGQFFASASMLATP